MKLRLATCADAPGISALIHELSHHFVARPGSAEAADFYKATNAERMAEYILEKNRAYVVAITDTDTEIGGFISLKDGTRISQFFVAPRHQGQGLGRRLWSKVRAVAGATDEREFTVDSSQSAAPVYQRFGFKIAGSLTEQGGVVFIPMRREAKKHAA